MKKSILLRGDFLYPDSDFITGMGSVLNISGNYFEFATSKDENAADCKAVRNDWAIVGQEIKNAINRLPLAMH